jgi:DNA-binding NarL/FixJ family response regulator
MNNNFSSNPVNVLIIDDDPVIVEQLSDAFKRFNEDRLPIPGGGPPGPHPQFQTDKCHTVENIDQYLHGSPEYGVFIIDKIFKNEKGEKVDKNLLVLKSLKDLQVAGLRIVWTAYTEHFDVVQSMRLGAWDYIDKKSVRHEGGDTFTDVIESAVEGLQAHDLERQRARTNIEGQEFLAHNYGKIPATYKGAFAAFGRDPDGKWSLEPLASHPSLCGLYLALEMKGRKDLENIHITFIQE